MPRGMGECEKLSEMVEDSRNGLVEVIGSCIDCGSRARETQVDTHKDFWCALYSPSKQGVSSLTEI